MVTTGDEHKQTMVFAELALGQIRARRQPVTPRNFELWYAHATGLYPSLNETINEILSRSGTLTDSDIQRSMDSHLYQTRLSERSGEVADRMMDEIEQIMSMVDAALGTAGNYSASIADASSKLPGADRDGLLGIVATLIQTAKEMEKSNSTFQERLAASKREMDQLQKSIEVVRKESFTDPVTSLANRKFFDKSLSDEIAAAASNNGSMSLLMADIDRFKTFNDKYGHLTGDQVLRLVAHCFKHNLKGQDIAVRYGGEEFVIILPNTALRSAVMVADHIRREVMSKELMKRSTGEHLGSVTISIGVATLRRGDNAQSLIARADTCLYAAKRAGRNRVVCEAD